MRTPSIGAMARGAVVAAATLVLAGCSTAPAQSDPLRRDAAVLAAARAAVRGHAETSAAEPPAAPAETAPPERQPTLIMGNDEQVRLPPARPVTVSAGGDVSLKFEQAPVTDVIHAILGDLLKLNYTIHQPITGEVTLHTQAPVPRAQVLPILDSVLQANGLVLVQDAHGLFHVGRPEAVKGIGNTPRRVGALAAGKNVVVVPLQYIGAAAMADILKPIAPPEAFVRVDELRNLLVLAGRRSEIDNWLEFVNIFDVDVLAGMSVGLFPLEHISVKEIEAVLRLASGEGQGSATRAVPPAAEAKGGQAAPVQPIPLPGPLGGVVKVLPLERMNAVLIITPRAHYLDAAREWIARLDRPNDGGSEPQLYVYPVQNGTAQHLADLLNAIFGGVRQEVRAASDSGVAPGLPSSFLMGGSLGPTTGSAPSALGTASSSPLGTSSAATLGGGAYGSAGAFGGLGLDSTTAPALQQSMVSQVSLGEKVRVVADGYNNALLIYAPRAEYAKIEAALRRLDLAPTQVLIEASILEVTLTDETRFGLQWFLEGSLGGGWRGSALLTQRNTPTIGAQVPGFSYSITNPAGVVRAVLNALAEKSLLNVISTPSVMVLDNQTATIHVGDQQPIQSAQTVTEGGTTISSIQYKDTGVVLSVTPSVNAGSMVSMLIRQSVTDVGNIDAATGQRAFLQRQIQSQVAVRSGETLVMGGLIRENNSHDKQGVPLLHDIPILGSLFGTTSKSATRTELLVMLTPRVVRSDQDVRELGAEIRQRMQGLKIVPGWQELDRKAPVETVPNDGAG